MEMDIKNLNSVIAKRVIDPANLKVGMLVSRIDYEGKKIENRYYISSIKSRIAINPLNKIKRKVVSKVRCYDMIADEFVDFTGASLLNFMQPSSTDFYDYQFTPVGENDNLKEDDYVFFMEPKKIQMTIKRGRPKHVFLITARYKDKYGEYADLVGSNGDYLLSVPLEFLVPVEFRGFIPVESIGNKNSQKNDEKPEVDKKSYAYHKLEKFKNKVEGLNNKLCSSSDLPKEFEENKKVNFGFSFSASDAGLKIKFYDQNHNSMSQILIDLSKNDSDSTKQIIAKYVSDLSMLSLSLSKINVNEKTISK